MDGIRDTSPSADLLLRPEAGCIGPAKSLRANRGGLGDDQPSRSTLRVVLCLQGRGHVIMRLRTHPGERRHNDAVRKIEVSHSICCKKRLIRHHMNSCIDRLHPLKRSRRLHREPPVTSATLFARLDIHLLGFLKQIIPGSVGQTPVWSEAVLNRSVLYDGPIRGEDAEILNYLVLYPRIEVWDARKVSAGRKCWKRQCPSSGSTGSRTRAFRNWNEPRV